MFRYDGTVTAIQAVGCRWRTGLMFSPRCYHARHQPRKEEARSRLSDHRRRCLPHEGCRAHAATALVRFTQRRQDAPRGLRATLFRHESNGVAGSSRKTCR